MPVADKKLSYYLRERIGPKRSRTPEGFLLCQDVPIARTGMMVYGPGEVPVEPGPDSLIYVHRSPEDVFRPETIASFNGKPVVIGHPDEDVNPNNWNQLAAGVVLNPHRGFGAEDDILLADLMITNKQADSEIDSGVREVSCGYDADYNELVPHRPGHARQFNIIGNHVALVESGRCGPRCAIGDQKTVDGKGANMSWIDKVKAAFAGKDEAALNAALAEAPNGAPVSLTNEQLKTIVKMTRDASKEDEDKEDEEKKKTGDRALDARMKKVEDGLDAVSKDVKAIKDAFEKKDDEDEEEKKKKAEDENSKILGSLEEEAPPGTGDKAAKAKDSAYLADSWDEAKSLAEVISPGISMPTFDHKAEPKESLTALCAFRRRVLDAAALQPETFVFMSNTAGGREHKSMTCDAVRTLFRAVGNFKKAQNNHASTSDVRPTPTASGGGNGAVGPILSPADLNKRNAEFYK